MFDNFDFNVLKDPDFKEDSVREELIVPIVKALGYSSSGSAKVVRSKSLISPLVAIGSTQRKVSIIPDYLFLSDDKALWILDAKSPSEDIFKSKHVEQAYSYAIHPEVRAQMYALCNGIEFVLYDIRKFEPILHFKLQNIGKYWEPLYRLLNATVQGDPELVNYKLDYGIFMKRIGAIDGFKLIAPCCSSKFIAKVEDGMYTTTSIVPGDVECALSLDFSEKQLHKLMSFQPKKLAEQTIQALKRQPYYIFLDTDEYEFSVVANLSKDIMHNAEESYISFNVVDFARDSEVAIESTP
jgi:hypothetical protein